MLRGYVKSNSQDILINFKTRNGTFGLKGWVSSHNFMLPFYITPSFYFGLSFLTILCECYYLSLLFYFLFLFSIYYNEIKKLIYKGDWIYLCYLFGIFFFLFNVVFNVISYLDISLITVVDAEETSSESENEYHTETSIREDPEKPGVVEKIYNSDGVKIQENYYDFVMNDGVQKKTNSKNLLLQ
jgi:hypothetical protein